VEEDNEFRLVDRHFQLEQHIAHRMAAPHWHEHIEINLLLSGTMTYLFNGRSAAVAAGQLVLFWAAIPHQTIAVSAGAPLVCVYLPLADFLALPLQRQTRRAVLQGDLLSATEPDPLDTLMAGRWVREWETADSVRRQLVIDEVKLRVRRLALDGARPPAGSGAPAGGSKPLAHQRVEALIELINRHYAEALSLGQLAALAGVHASTINRDFRAVLGLTMNEYLMRYRLARSMHLLAETEEPVLQIAYGCGFGSASRFYELFRARVGATPRQFRARLRDAEAAGP